ncbi:MAG: hypothetical protein LJE69_13495, partial [Thiohalocapsa sp.]|uniref:hypothetical protein n=1 Tax=Thiohalocapsa sp. TaxID=2497641 RepID=UPI0025D1BB65
GTATTERNLDQHPRPGSRKRSPYSRPFLARMLLTLEDYRPLLDGLSDALTNISQGAADQHNRLFAEPASAA